MQTFSSLTVLTTLIHLVMTTSTRHSPLSSAKSEHEFLTCEQIYGAGSITCGGEGSRFCFNPSRLGETCCLLDEGYCTAGNFCSSVAGFCCRHGEDPLDCAARQELTLLPTFSTTTAPTITGSEISLAIEAPNSLSPQLTVVSALAVLRLVELAPRVQSPSENKDLGLVSNPDTETKKFTIATTTTITSTIQVFSPNTVVSITIDTSSSPTPNRYGIATSSNPATMATYTLVSWSKATGTVPDIKAAVSRNRTADESFARISGGVSHIEGLLWRLGCVLVSVGMMFVLGL